MGDRWLLFAFPKCPLREVSVRLFSLVCEVLSIVGCTCSCEMFMSATKQRINGRYLDTGFQNQCIIMMAWCRGDEIHFLPVRAVQVIAGCRDIQGLWVLVLGTCLLCWPSPASSCTSWCFPACQLLSAHHLFSLACGFGSFGPVSVVFKPQNILESFALHLLRFHSFLRWWQQPFFFPLGTRSVI